MKRLLILCLLLSGCAAYQAHQLEGLSATQIKWKLGTPVLKRTESPYQLWTYRQGECSTLVFFDDKDIVQHADIVCP